MKFGRYELLEVIGQGGMGKVYKAYDTVMGRDVAIKLLSAHLAAEPGFRERFRREAVTAGRLSEPHIIPIYDSNEIDGCLYLVMPIIDGIDVKTALKRDGPMTPSRAVGVIEQLAAALDAAHARGLVHRDVKPSNVMLADHDAVYLIDFGIAHDATAPKLTRTGENPGTPVYMAPEGFNGEKIDARADIYGLTCVLYECLTTSPPFPYHTDAHLRAAHLYGDPPRPSQQSRGVPATFDDVIVRGMAKNPDQRYQSAGDLAIAARAALSTPLHEHAAGTSHRSQAKTAESLPARTAPHSPTEFVTPAGMEGLRPAGIRAASFPWPPASQPERAPYRGWEPFQPIDAGVFFGRDAELARAIEALRGMRQGEETLFVVLGASGAGKSCFLRAGIVPRLQNDRSYLVLDIVRPEFRALTGDSGLAQAIYTTRQQFGLTKPPLGDIKDACTRGDVGKLRAWLIECCGAATRHLLDTTTDRDPVSVVLPLDQAEELFTAGAGAEAASFLALVRDLALGNDAQEGLPLIVAAAIRTDRYELMQTSPELVGLQIKQFDLRPMDPTQFHSVITGPAQRSTDGGRPLYLDEELVGHLLTDASDGADTLPLLSLTMAWLYRDYGSTGRLILRPYAERGGIDSVVHAEIDGLLSAESHERAEQLKLLRATFIPWLATINPDNDQPMRRLARWDDLPHDSRPLIDKFVGRRLLIKDLRDGVVVVEVALESLLRQWDDLAIWLAEERQNLKAADTLERGASDWDKNHRDDAWLLYGTRLTEAENLAARPGFADRLNPTRDYLLASRQRENERAELEKQRQHAELEAAKNLAAAESSAKEQAEARANEAQAHAVVLRKRSRILRAVLVATTVVAIVAVVGAIVAVVMFNRATREARDALAAKLDTDASTVFSRATSADSDIHALADTLAAQRLRSDPSASRGAFYAATTALNTTRIIIPMAEPVHTVAFSPDGHTLATGSRDHTVRLWNVAEPARPAPFGQPLTGHTEDVRSVAFSPDGHTLASASAGHARVSVGADHTIRLWNVTDPTRPVPLAPPLTGHTDGVLAVAFSPDGHILASGGRDHTVRLWDLTDPTHPTPLGPPLTSHTDMVFSVAFSPDGHTLASGSADHTVRLWNLTDPTRPAPLGEPLTGHTNGVSSVAFSPDGHTLASGSGDATIRLWNVTDPIRPAPLGQPLTGHTNGVTALAFSSSGHTLASCGLDATVRLWDLFTDPAHPGPLGRPLTGHTDAVTAVVFSRDGHTLASGSGDATIRLWNLDSALPFRGDTAAVNSAVFSPDRHILASGSGDGSINFLDVTNPAHPASLGQRLRALNPVARLAFRPDGHILASGSVNGTIRLWNLADQTHPAPLGEPLTGHTDAVYSLAFSPDGHILASGSLDGTIRLWNLADPTRPAPLGQPLTGHTDQVYGVAFSPDGRTLASGNHDDTIRLWNLADPTHPAPLGQPLTGHTGDVRSVAFSSDGHTLASASNDHTLRLWDLTDLSHVGPLGQPLMGHTNVVFTVAFSPDGHNLASGAADDTVRLWDLTDPAHPAPLGEPLTGHTDAVYSVAFSPDGHSLASGSNDHTMRLWPTPLDATVANLCSKLISNITYQEWHDWISPTIGYITLCPNLPIAADNPNW